MYYNSFVVREFDQVAEELVVFLAVKLADDDSFSHPVDAVPRYSLAFFHLLELPIPALIRQKMNDAAQPREYNALLWVYGSVVRLSRKNQHIAKAKIAVKMYAIAFFIVKRILFLKR